MKNLEITYNRWDNIDENDLDKEFLYVEIENSERRRFQTIMTISIIVRYFSTFLPLF